VVAKRGAVESGEQQHGIALFFAYAREPVNRGIGSREFIGERCVVRDSVSVFTAERIRKSQLGVATIG
jgi:hypothetical protein